MTGHDPYDEFEDEDGDGGQFELEDDDDLFEDDDDLEDVGDDEETAAEDDIDPRVLADIEHGLEQARGRIGRPLTNAEIQGAMQEAFGAVQSGGGPIDVANAVYSTTSTAKPPHEMTSDERTRWMVDRAHDLAPGPPIVADDRTLDIHGNAQDRHDFVIARAVGEEFDTVEIHEDAA